MFTSIEEVQRLMETQSYIADRALATTLFLAIKLAIEVHLLRQEARAALALKP